MYWYWCLKSSLLHAKLSTQSQRFFFFKSKWIILYRWKDGKINWPAVVPQKIRTSVQQQGLRGVRLSEVPVNDYYPKINAHCLRYFPVSLSLRYLSVFTFQYICPTLLYIVTCNVVWNVRHNPFQIDLDVFIAIPLEQHTTYKEYTIYDIQYIQKVCKIYTIYSI